MKEFKGINHGSRKIDLTHLRKQVIEFTPVEIHTKEDGDINDQPSFTIVLEKNGVHVFGQISLRMLNKGLADIGYKLIKE